jgi:hypothetical protein
MIVSGVGYLIEALVRVGLGFLLPIPAFLIVSPLLAFGGDHRVDQLDGHLRPHQNPTSCRGTPGTQWRLTTLQQICSCTSGSASLAH